MLGTCKPWIECGGRERLRFRCLGHQGAAVPAAACSCSRSYPAAPSGRTRIAALLPPAHPRTPPHPPTPRPAPESRPLQVATSEVVTGPIRLLFPRIPGSIGEAAQFPYSLLGELLTHLSSSGLLLIHLLSTGLLLTHLSSTGLLPTHLLSSGLLLIHLSSTGLPGADLYLLCSAPP